MSLKKRGAITGSVYFVVGVIAVLSFYPIFMEFGPLLAGFVFIRLGVPQARKWAAAQAGIFTGVLAVGIVLVPVFLIGLATATETTSESGITVQNTVDNDTVWSPLFIVITMSLNAMICAAVGALGGYLAEATRGKNRSKRAGDIDLRSIDLRDHLKE